MKRTDLIVYTLHVVNGVFGRNRTPKTKSFKLHEGTSPIADTEVRRLMIDAIARERVRPGARLHVTETPEYTEERDDGITIRGFQIGNGRTVIPIHVL